MRRIAIACLLSCLAAQTAGGSGGGQKLSASIRPAAEPDRQTFEPGEALELRLSLIDLVDGQPVGGLHPAGFVRPRTEHRSSCTDAARAYRATGRVALDSIDLSGVTLLVGQKDGMLAAVDPSMSLASANMRWIAHVRDGQAPTVHVAEGRIVAAGEGIAVISDADGKAMPIDPYGKDGRLLGLSRDGRWAYLGAGDAPGLRIVDLTGRLPARDLDLTSVAATAVDGGETIAVLSEEGDRLTLVDAAQGKMVAEHRLAAPAANLAYSTVADAVAAAAGATLHLVHLDAPQELRSIALAGAASRVAISADQRSAFAYETGTGLVNVVDLVRERLVQALHFPDGVAGLTSTHDSLAVLAAHRWVVASVSTDTLKAGLSPNVTEVRLPEGAPTPAETPGPLITAAGPVGPILVAQPGTREVYVMPHEPGMRAPTNAVRVRGAEITSIAILARSFERQGDEYRAVFSMPRPGRYEAVVTAGLFDAHGCIPFDVGDAPAAETVVPPRLSLRLPMTALAGAPVSLVMQIAEGDARSATVDLHVFSANDNFQFARSTRLSDDGTASFDLSFPHEGTSIVSAVARTPSGQQARAVEQIEVMP